MYKVQSTDFALSNKSSFEPDLNNNDVVIIISIVDNKLLSKIKDKMSELHIVKGVPLECFLFLDFIGHL